MIFEVLSPFSIASQNAALAVVKPSRQRGPTLQLTLSAQAQGSPGLARMSEFNAPNGVLLSGQEARPKALLACTLGRLGRPHRTSVYRPALRREVRSSMHGHSLRKPQCKMLQEAQEFSYRIDA